MNPLVSVLITTYNGDEYIVETLESIINQTYDDIEIIIVDDGSTDNTFNKLKPYSDKIIYYFQQNKGTYGALNIAYSMAKGKYIAIQDHDDISMPDRIAKEVDILENNPRCCFVYSSAIFIDKHGNRISKWDIKKKEMVPFYAYRDLYVSGNFIPHSSILYNRKYIDDRLPYNPELRICGDFYFILNLTIKYPIIKYPYPLIKIRKGLSNQVTENRYALFKEEKKVLYSIYKKYNISHLVFWSSLSNQFLKEAKYYWKTQNYLQVIHCLIKSSWRNPINIKLWIFILDLYFLTIKKLFKRYIK